MKDNALYLEADEDITSAIDKLSKITADSVQIVVPKRSSMLQSIINLKLLKKAAETNGKELVLVTNDRIAGELAARVGLAVAPSLGAKAVVAESKQPAELKTSEEIIEADEPDAPPAPAVEPPPKQPKRPPLLSRRPVSDGPPAPPAPAAPAAAAATTATDGASAATDAAPKLSGPKVPNFNRLQRRLIWVAAAVVLIGGYAGAMYLLASAKVTLYAIGTKVDIDTTFTVDPGTKTSDTTKAVLAGQTVTVSKDLSTPFTPTGSKDNGTKAIGAMTIYNEYDTNSHLLVAGSRLQAPDGKVFRTKADVTVPGATVGLSGGKIVLNPGKSDPVSVEADANGDTYNEAAARYVIMGYSGDQQTKIYGQGAQMSGGTSKTVTVVTQADVDKAKADLIAKDKDNAARDLDGHVPSGYTALTATQASSADTTTSAPAVGAEGTAATLSIKLTYTELAVKTTDYQAMLRAQELKQIGAANQVYDDGLSAAQVTATNKDSSGRQGFHLSTQAYGGAKIDKTALATQLAGKRYGDATDLAGRQPGVQHAEVSLKPAWSTSLPGRSSKITIVIKVADTKD